MEYVSETNHKSLERNDELPLIYNYLGQPAEADDVCVAMQHGEKYWIARCKKGHRQGLVFDASNDRHVLTSHKRDQFFKLERANKETFTYYLNYLQTRNQLWLRKADKILS